MLERHSNGKAPVDAGLMSSEPPHRKKAMSQVKMYTYTPFDILNMYIYRFYNGKPTLPKWCCIFRPQA